MPYRVLRLFCGPAFLLAFGAGSFAQSPSYPTDTSYVSELLKKGQDIQDSKPTVALQHYASAYKLAKKIGYRKGYFESVRLYSYALNLLGQHEAARRVGNEAIEQAKADTSNRHKSLGYFVLASTALYEGKLREAVPLYQKVVTHLLRSDKPENVSAIYQNLGLIYERQELYPQALDYYNRALRIDSKYEDYPRYIATDYYSIANIYDRQDKHELAKTYYQKARHWIDPRKDPDFMVNLYNNIGQLYLEEAQSHSSPLPKRQQLRDSSFYYHREALRLSRVLKNPVYEAHQLNALAKLYNDAKQYRQAGPLLAEALRMIRQHGNELTERRAIYREYVNLNLGLGNHKAAYEWRDRYDAVNDSLNNQETKDLLSDYEVKLKQAEAGQQLAEKQRQIAELKAGRKRQQLWLLIAVLTAAVVGVGLLLGFLYYRQRQRTAANALLAAERERELAVVQSELAGQQKERLRISKEMHDDMGASLTAIGLLSEVMKSRMGSHTTPEVEKISSISAEMVTSMNEIIWSLNTRNDSLNGLIAYIRSYASEFIDNTTLTLRTQVEESPDEINVRGVDRRNVFLTVKEALNNVVKHAQATEVTLVIQPEADHLRIEVGDNGRGFGTNGRAGGRNGLTNMQNRMAESGGTCTISPSPSGTCVKITYPYAAVPAGKILQTQYSA